ncbi:MAG: cell division protein ZapD [Gallionellales bacterium GWA2_60_142]|nr:MAG: cell division protein ZapD [Gallionellales bacterium GWA2_60_142]HCI13957.1 cell division protein ZapD [Gallionellaceae bacterium]
MISYEFPLNEKMRTLLRLEDLFARMRYFTAQDSSMEHHAALTTLFEILEVSSRADLKSELLQELERQKRLLAALHNNPAISEDALDAILNEIEHIAADLLAMSGKIGQHLRDNEWLMGIKQRACMPGGTCEFDLPSYHYWQEQDAPSRRRDLQTWLTPLLPIAGGMNIVLRLLRESGKVLRFTAHQGAFQQMQGGRVAQMLRVSLNRDLACIPEVGANKYAINIRFIAANYAAKTTRYDQDVPFELTFCSLSS